MATVSGQGTTFNLPNYTGELYNTAPSDTPFLSAIGGLNGGRTVNSTEFEWQVEGLESTSANNAVVEGADAPTASGVDRSNVTNVVEIHQEAIEVSYTRQAAVGLHAGTNNEEVNPVRDELQHQINLKLRKIGVDVEKSFLSGTYSKPSTNAIARKTRGILSAITTNKFQAGTPGTPRDLTTAIINAALSDMYSNGAQLPQNETVLLVSPATKVSLSGVYATATMNWPTPSRTLGGIAIDTVMTDFGTFGVVVNRWMPAKQIAVLDLSVCRPVFLNVPGKGNLFVEPLAKTGSADKFQIYGEIGLQYGPEVYHGLIADLKA